MNENDNIVTIQYKTGKEYCHCCEQKLPKVKIGQTREFEFSKDNALGYAPWKEIIDCGDDFGECVKEFVYDTIGFFAVGFYETIIIENSEFYKVEQFILSYIK